MGYFTALFIGISLGLIGGGGSILTVPVLVYLMGTDPVIATAYSLFVVGAVSLVGAISKARKGLVNVKIAFIFSIPAFITLYCTRYFFVPRLPDTLFSVNGIEVSKGTGIMIFFSLLMIFASISMIKKDKPKNVDKVKKEVRLNYFLISLEGIVVGFLTGIVGAGGGFLIIPALVLIAKLPMKIAVGTSLLIIAIKSLIGFVGDLQAGQDIEWLFLIIFTFIAIIGIFIGEYLSNFISGEKLKKIFGLFTLSIAIFIMIKELFL